MRLCTNIILVEQQPVKINTYLNSDTRLVILMARSLERTILT